VGGGVGVEGRAPVALVAIATGRERRQRGAVLCAGKKEEEWGSKKKLFWFILSFFGFLGFWFDIIQIATHSRLTLESSLFYFYFILCINFFKTLDKHLVIS